MAVTMTGTIKTGGAFEVKGKQGPQLMISFVLVDEVGNGFSCQMWPDDPQHAALAQVIGYARRRPVQCTVAGYTVRMREDKKTQTQVPQANFVVTGVTIPDVITPQGLVAQAQPVQP